MANWSFLKISLGRLALIGCIVFFFGALLRFGADDLSLISYTSVKSWEFKREVFIEISRLLMVFGGVVASVSAILHAQKGA